MRTIKNIALAAVLAVFSLPALACVTVGEETAWALSLVPDAVVTSHRGAVTQRLLAVFNAAPPVTEFAADRAVVYSSQGLPDVLVALFLDGCRVGGVRMDKSRYLSLVGATSTQASAGSLLQPHTV